VLRVYGADEHEGRVGIWTELLNGETLEEKLDRQGPMSAAEAALVGSTSAGPSLPSITPGSCTATSRLRTSCARRAGGSCSWTSARRRGGAGRREAGHPQGRRSRWRRSSSEARSLGPRRTSGAWAFSCTGS
jgi:hypothetical protein